jgi:hypothetical protein
MFAYTPNVESFSSTIHWNVAIIKKQVLELCGPARPQTWNKGRKFSNSPELVDSAFILFHVHLDVLVGPRNGAAADCEAAAPAIAGHARVPVGAECFFFDSPNGTKE